MKVAVACALLASASSVAWAQNKPIAWAQKKPIAWAQKKPMTVHQPADRQRPVVGTRKADALAREPGYTRHQVAVATKLSERTKPSAPAKADTEKPPPLSADDARDIDGVDWAHVEELPTGCSSFGPCL